MIGAGLMSDTHNLQQLIQVFNGLIHDKNANSNLNKKAIIETIKALISIRWGPSNITNSLDYYDTLTQASNWALEHYKPDLYRQIVLKQVKITWMYADIEQERQDNANDWE